MDRQVQTSMIVVVGDWNGDPVPVGAISVPTYDAFVEAGEWEARRRTWWEQSGLTEEMAIESLREIRLRAWLPAIYDMPEVSGDVEEPPE